VSIDTVVLVVTVLISTPVSALTMVKLLTVCDAAHWGCDNAAAQAIAAKTCEGFIGKLLMRRAWREPRQEVSWDMRFWIVSGSLQGTLFGTSQTLAARKIGGRPLVYARVAAIR
jgi:hypothetical protein